MSTSQMAFDDVPGPRRAGLRAAAGRRGARGLGPLVRRQRHGDRAPAAPHHLGRSRAATVYGTDHPSRRAPGKIRARSSVDATAESRRATARPRVVAGGGDGRDHERVDGIWPVRPPGRRRRSTSANTAALAGAGLPRDNSGNRAVWLGGLLVVIVLLALLIAFIGALRHWFAAPHGDPARRTGRVLQLLVRLRVRPRRGDPHQRCGHRCLHRRSQGELSHRRGVGGSATIPFEGTPYILCKHHHPDVPNHGATHETILAQHHKFKLEKAVRRRPRPERLDRRCDRHRAHWSRWPPSSSSPCATSSASTRPTARC